MQQETATIANHIPQIQLAAIHVFPAYFLNTKECDKSTLFRANVNISPVFYPIFFRVHCLSIHWVYLINVECRPRHIRS